MLNLQDVKLQDEMAANTEARHLKNEFNNTCTARPPSFSKENVSIAASADSLCRSESDIRGAEQRVLSAADWTLHRDTLHTGRYHPQWLQGHSVNHACRGFFVTGLKAPAWLHFYYVHERVVTRPVFSQSLLRSSYVKCHAY